MPQSGELPASDTSRFGRRPREWSLFRIRGRRGQPSRDPETAIPLTQTSTLVSNSSQSDQFTTSSVPTSISGILDAQESSSYLLPDTLQPECEYYAEHYIHNAESNNIPLETKRLVKKLAAATVHQLHDKAFSFSACMTSLGPQEQPSRTLLITCETQEQKQAAQHLISSSSCSMIRDFADENELEIRYGVNDLNVHSSNVQTELSIQALASKTQLIKISPATGSTSSVQLYISFGANGMRSTTWGGIISIGGVLFGMTVAHAFREEISAIPVPFGLDPLYTLDVSSYHNSPDEVLDIDLALVDLSTLPQEAIPNLLLESEFTAYSMRGIASMEEPVDCRVDIVTGNCGVVPGSLNGTAQLLRIGSSCHIAYLIVLKQRLEIGCSGSWVCKGMLVVGYIVAVNKQLPWAYMLSIEDAFGKLSDRFGEPVTVASQQEIEAYIIGRIPVIPLGHDTPRSHCLYSAGSPMRDSEISHNLSEHSALSTLPDEKPVSKSTSMSGTPGGPFFRNSGSQK